jgi:ATP-dependent RNA helicase SUPV3L1/SUV3
MEGEIELTATRIQAAQALPQLLSRDVTWREAVLTSLRDQLSMTLQGNKRKARSVWTKDAKRWYQDSLPSFHDRLEAGDYPESVAKALDGLARAGFDTRTFQRNYRSVAGYRYEMEKTNTQILEQESDCRLKSERVVAGKIESEKLQTQLDSSLSMKPGDTVGQSSTPTPLWSQAVDAVKTLFSGGSNASEEAGRTEPVPKKMDRKTRLLEEKMNRRIAQNDGHEAALEAAREKLDHLRESRSQLKPLLSNEEYDRATEAIEEVKEDICHFLAEHVADRYSQILERYQTLDKKTDLTRPHEWFPYARLDKRKIIFHAGPTNSGKTWNALERLKQAKKGMYLGPLRLLAAEVYEQLTAEGIYCNLYTGQEKRILPFATHTAATVEMASMVDDLDVVVIDEIQMIGDIERGFAWTRALIGSRCPEIHVCGGMEAEPILRKLTAACGDELEIRTYERFSALTVAKKSLANSSKQLESYKHVEKGDCVVAFSRNDIFAIKREIEKLTDLKCCVIYGSLPPQTRSEQARLFNDPDSGFDVLVASDAIGMGLNLNIRRIVFNSMFKNDGKGIVQLDHSAVKQISGRAGRRNSPFPEGIVTCRNPDDMAHLVDCMATEIEPVARAGLLPTASHLETFDLSLQEYGEDNAAGSMYTVLKQFSEMASVKNDYFLCRQTPMHEIAKAVDEYPLSVLEKYTLCMCPVSVNSSRSMHVLKRFAAKISSGEVSGLSQTMIPRKPKSFEDLSALCGIFSDLDLFLWLQNKFPPGNYIEQQNAQALKEIAITMITEALENTERLRLTHCYATRDKRVRLEWKRNKGGRQDGGKKREKWGRRDTGKSDDKRGRHDGEKSPSRRKPHGKRDNPIKEDTRKEKHGKPKKAVHAVPW